MMIISAAKSISVEEFRDKLVEEATRQINIAHRQQAMQTTVKGGLRYAGEIAALTAFRRFMADIKFTEG